MINRKIKFDLLEALTDSPVVLIHGARQTGKSTLVKNLSEKDYPAKYLTFDDISVLSAAQNNPQDFISGYNENLIIDEVQRVPEIFLAIKSHIDKKRKAGKYILTGSANVLLLPKISESLAGRIEIIELFPFSQSEINNTDYNLIDELFKDDLIQKYGDPKSGNDPSIKNNLTEKILTGGYPEMLERKNRGRQKAWFKSYITTILQRDVRDISSVEKLNQLPKLLSLFAARAGTLINFAELSRSSSIPQTTLKRYVALFEAIFMIYLLPAWSGNLSKRLIKAPKLYLNDTGLLSFLTGFEEKNKLENSLSWGRIIENFVLMELTKQASWSEFDLSLFHFRSASGQEVDFIIERIDGQLIAVEVKATSKITSSDFKHIKVFSDEIGKKFSKGIVFYTGKEIIPFAKNLFAVPLEMLL